MPTAAVNVMSIDLEDWFCVQNLTGVIRRDDWPKLDYRVEKNTLRLLDLFSRHKIEATFFVLGWVAERSPGVSPARSGGPVTRSIRIRRC